MNLGKRIEIRLLELEWDRNTLLDQVPDLTPQRLSALIRRDSRRCELDRQIAVALGVHLHWLNDGVEPKLLTSASTPSRSVSARVRRIIARLEAIENAGGSPPKVLSIIESALDLAKPEASTDGYPGLKQLPEE